MPTLAMHETATHPDGWHAVTAPGGYEWWYFDAEDAQRDLQIVAILFDGFVFHPGYLRAEARYRRRPTRSAPPLPGHYPCAYFVVYRGGRVWRQFMTQFSPGALQASREGLDLQLGANRIQASGDDADAPDDAILVHLSGTPWHITARGPKLIDEPLSATLRFTPRLSHRPAERIFLSRAMTGADHHWVIANPLCNVAGTIECAGESIAFAGRGYHDHNFGTGPLGPGLRRWIWGRVLADDRVLTFHHAVPARGEPETHLLIADASGVRELHVVEVLEKDWRRTAWGLSYPRSLSIAAKDPATGQAEIMLFSGDLQAVDSSPFYLRLAGLAGGKGGWTGHVFCEVAYPHRLRWPVLGRMIEMSIDKRAVR